MQTVLSMPACDRDCIAALLSPGTLHLSALNVNNPAEHGREGESERRGGKEREGERAPDGLCDCACFGLAVEVDMR